MVSSAPPVRNIWITIGKGDATQNIPENTTVVSAKDLDGAIAFLSSVDLSEEYGWCVVDISHVLTSLYEPHQPWEDDQGTLHAQLRHSADDLVKIKEAIRAKFTCLELMILIVCNDDLVQLDKALNLPCFRGGVTAWLPNDALSKRLDLSGGVLILNGISKLEGLGPPGGVSRLNGTSNLKLLLERKSPYSQCSLSEAARRYLGTERAQDEHHWGRVMRRQLEERVRLYESEPQSFLTRVFGCACFFGSATNAANPGSDAVPLPGAVPSGPPAPG